MDGLRKEMKGKDDLIRQQGFYSDGSGPVAHMEEYAALEIAQSSEHACPSETVTLPVFC